MESRTIPGIPSGRTIAIRRSETLTFLSSFGRRENMRARGGGLWKGPFSPLMNLTVMNCLAGRPDCTALNLPGDQKTIRLLHDRNAETKRRRLFPGHNH